jgi:nicotinate-nucleotide--dimethylbenzimidazole phosphoribosyltransferase
MKLLEATCAKIAPLDATARALAKTRLDQLTMPHWALGRLMDLALELAGITARRGRRRAQDRRGHGGDHGVTAEGSASTRGGDAADGVQLAAGGAGINALARLVGAGVQVIDMGVRGDLRLASAGKIKRFTSRTARRTWPPAPR